MVTQIAIESVSWGLGYKRQLTRKEVAGSVQA